MKAYIFLCDNITETECLQRSLFGTNKQHNQYADLKIGDTLFLYNFESRYIMGPFMALTKCIHGLVPLAWDKRFQFQVRVLDERKNENRISRRLLNDIFGPGNKFDFRIDETQCKILINKLNESISEPEIVNYYIFKCNNYTGSIIYDNNIVGAPAETFRSIVNRIQKGDKIFVYNYEAKELYGLWQATGRGYYQPGAFKFGNIDFPAVVPVELNINYKKRINEKRLKEIINFLQYPPYEIQYSDAINILNEFDNKNELIVDSVADSSRSNLYTSAGLYLTDDGHRVRSMGELIIDNWLYSNRLLHSYEKRIQIGNKYRRCDFYLPSNKIHLEYWGLFYNDDYRNNIKERIQFYNDNNLKLVSIYPNDVRMLDETLIPKLSQMGVGF